MLIGMIGVIHEKKRRKEYLGGYIGGNGACRWRLSENIFKGYEPFQKIGPLVNLFKVMIPLVDTLGEVPL